MLRQRHMARILATRLVPVGSQRGVQATNTSRDRGRLRHLGWSLGFLMIGGCVSPIAAQEISTETAAVAADTSTDRATEDDPGQSARRDGAPPTPQHTGIKAMIKGLGQDVINLPSRQNLLWVGAGTGLSLAVHPLDDTANEALSGDIWDKVFAPGAIMGQSYTLLGVAGTVYAVGRIKGQPKVSHIGMDLIRSVLIAEFITESLKYTVRRERPDGSGAN